MSGFIFVRNVRFRFCTKCLVSLLYEMSGFVFVRNVWFRFCTKCLVLVFVRDVCTKSRVYELSCPPPLSRKYSVFFSNDKQTKMIDSRDVACLKTVFVFISCWWSGWSRRRRTTAKWRTTTGDTRTRCASSCSPLSPPGASGSTSRLCTQSPSSSPPSRTTWTTGAPTTPSRNCSSVYLLSLFLVLLLFFVAAAANC